MLLTSKALYWANDRDRSLIPFVLEYGEGGERGEILWIVVANMGNLNNDSNLAWLTCINRSMR